MDMEFYSEERKELKKKVELLLQKQKDIIVILKILAKSTEKQKDIIEILKILAKSTEAVKKTVIALWRGAKQVGESRVEDCVYSRAGYCEHPASAMVGRSESKVDTTKIKGRYYPAVSWSMCYLCTKYEVPPEEVASK